MFKVYCFILLLLFIPKILFSTNDEYKRVYLASFPRSGNTWTWNLIESATHLQMSVWVEGVGRILRPWGAYSENLSTNSHLRFPKKGDIVVIKTHHPLMVQSILPYTKTIRIVRHPIDSFYSFYVFNHNYYKPNDKLSYIIPKNNLKQFIQDWKIFHNYWNNQENVFTFRYEDLFNDPINKFTQILREIGYNLSIEEIEGAVIKYPPEGGILKHLSHYNKDDLKLISIELKDLMDQFGYSIDLPD